MALTGAILLTGCFNPESKDSVTATSETPGVTPAKASSLRVSIHSSITSWATIVHQAVNTINAAKTRVHLEVVPAGQAADITVYSDASASCPAALRNVASTIYGIAFVASGGNPGNAIAINMDHTGFGTTVSKVHTMTHEFSHTLGLYHSNESYGTHIVGTAVSDPYSIVQAQSLYRTGTLSYNDLLAYEILYPSDKPLGGTTLDGDTKDDIVVFRPANGTWYAALSSKNLLSGSSTQWGMRGDVPVIGTDIDQDGKRDIVVWRPSTATWHIKKSNANFTTSVSYVYGQ